MISPGFLQSHLRAACQVTVTGRQRVATVLSLVHCLLSAQKLPIQHWTLLLLLLLSLPPPLPPVLAMVLMLTLPLADLREMQREQ